MITPDLDIIKNMTETDKSKPKNRAACGHLERIVKSFVCFFTGGHSWTSKAMEGIPPTSEQIDNGVAGFYDYAEMYCGKCGRISQVSKNWRNRNE